MSYLMNGIIIYETILTHTFLRLKQKAQLFEKIHHSSESFFFPDEKVFFNFRHTKTHKLETRQPMGRVKSAKTENTPKFPNFGVYCTRLLPPLAH